MNHNIKSSKDFLSAITKIKLSHPNIDITLKQSGEKAETGKDAKPIDIPAFTLNEPIIHISRENESGITKLASADGGNISVKGIQLKNKVVSTAGTGY